MGSFFKFFAGLSLAAWFLALLAIAANSLRTGEPSLAGATVWLVWSVFGLLPTAALFHIAGAVSDVVDLLEAREERDRSTPESTSA